MFMYFRPNEIKYGTGYPVYKNLSVIFSFIKTEIVEAILYIGA